MWMNSMDNKVMKEGENDKFFQNIHLKDFLVQTGKKVIMEANSMDTHWSCGLSAKNRTGILDMETGLKKGTWEYPYGNSGLSG